NVCQRADGPELRNDAASAATLSTVFFASGAALVAGGVTMFFLAPKSTATTGLRVQPSVGSRTGLIVSGSF
ncbi:MAG TPA: hypothetical protein VM580_28530, partial [Labilithrix sp.]|nr:hypothetical protein [Labilithrix sp.]